MWKLQAPKPAKLIIAILAADENHRKATVDEINASFGKTDCVSDSWPFDKTDYYRDETGENILRQFVSIEKLVDPAKLAKIKLKTNKIEQRLAEQSASDLLRPVNLDPGIVEPSKLVLATTKNYSHRIYIGKKIFAEVTLIYDKGAWRPFDYTYPDYRQNYYHDFFSKVRTQLVEQLKSKH